MSIQQRLFFCPFIINTRISGLLPANYKTLLPLSALSFVRLGGWTAALANTLQWHHYIFNHHRLDCLLNLLFRRGSKKTSKLRVIGLWPVNSPHKGPVTRKMSPFHDVIMWLDKVSNACIPHRTVSFLSKVDYQSTLSWFAGVSVNFGIIKWYLALWIWATYYDNRNSRHSVPFWHSLSTFSPRHTNIYIYISQKRKIWNITIYNSNIMGRNYHNYHRTWCGLYGNIVVLSDDYFSPTMAVFDVVCVCVCVEGGG